MQIFLLEIIFLAVANCLMIEKSENPGFRSLLVQVLRQTDPRVIPTANDGEKGIELDPIKTGGAFKEGLYFNTSRPDLDQNYIYMW